MGPRQHKKFEDSDPTKIQNGEVLSKKQLKKLKKQQQKEHDNDDDTTNGQQESPILGPLNISRLKAIETNQETLSDGDLRFHSSEEEPLKPATPAPKIVNYRDSEDEDEDVKRPSSGETKKPNIEELKNKRIQLKKERQNLPIFAASDQVLSHVFKNKVTILIGETGSGKSTQLPQLIYNHEKDKKGHKIAITQPRRVAAINLATRVAQEMGTVLGNKVGYTVRFQNKAGDSTNLKYLTDGMLMREILLDPNLSRYNTIILDEAHERTVLTDMLMGLIKRLLQGPRASDLRVVIMSATLDAQRFSDFYENAPILYVQGRTYPVQRYYIKSPLDNVVDGVVHSVCQINMAEPYPGDILVFLAGQEEIDRCVDRLNTLAPYVSGKKTKTPGIVAMPLYASLPPNLQQRVFEPLSEPNHRKIILATNIAETSLTISGVRYVIDSGLRKVRVWKPELGLDALLATHISKANAAQRMGRAGREAPGKCFRLFTESTYEEELPSQTEPEILRCDVASTVLMLKNAGVSDVVNFQWLQTPSKKSIRAALLKLYTLKALGDSGEVTDLGKEMALLPVSPHLAAVLIHGKNQGPPGLLQSIIDIVSCLSVDDLLINPHPEKRDEINERRRIEFGGGIEYGDLIMLKELFEKYYIQCTNKKERKQLCESTGVNLRGMENVLLVRRQLQSYMKVTQDHSTAHIPSQDIIKCFLHGFVSNTALGLPDRRYKTVLTNQFLNIHPSSMLFGKKCDAIMYMEYVYTTKGYARMVSPIHEDWLQEVAPHLLARGHEA